MGLGILVFLTALVISAVAIYYSVAGLVAIFAAATIPIIIMGSSLEIAKLITAVWLHRYWGRTKWWLKTYLAAAVLVLMLITSMGIFGFLSKAHIEQTAAGAEGAAQVERLDAEIARQQAIIARADEKIRQVETSGTGADANLQQQIDKEQARVDSAYERIQQAEASMASRLQPLQQELDNINSTLAELSTALSSNEVEKVQGIVGAAQDGKLGPKTSQKIEDFRIAKQQRREVIITQMEDARRDNPGIEIARKQIEDGNALINRLRSQLGQGNAADIDSIVNEQQQRIKDADEALDKLTEEKYSIQAEQRKLEAEVGPIKYIAEFVFDTTDQSTLEESVRWMIVVIIFVFDPLAVLLLIASQYTFRYHREDNPEPRGERKWTKIIPTLSIKDTFPENTEEEEEDWIKRKQEIAREKRQREQSVSESTTPVEELLELTPEEKDRAARFEVLEQDIDMKAAKVRWKDENPDQTLKEYKNAYIKGHIDKLPWEDYVEDPIDNTTGQDPQS